MTRDLNRSRIKHRPLRGVQALERSTILSPEWEEVFWSLMEKDSFNSCRWCHVWDYPGIDNGIEHDGPERMKQTIERKI